MTLIRELTQEHARILNSLMAMHEHGVATPLGQAALLRAREELTAHMDKEERLFYAPLRAVAAHNPTLQRTVEIFIQDIPALTSEVMAFFDKYEDNQVGDDYGHDYSTMTARLRTRIRREEMILFKEYLAAI